MSKKLRLAGCPCCGGKAFWSKGSKETRRNDMVQCLQCHLMMEGDYTPQSALKLWNSRVMDWVTQDRQVDINGDES